MNLLIRLNTDAFDLLIREQDKYPSCIKNLFTRLQSATSVYDLSYEDLITLYAFLPDNFWDCRITSVANLFTPQPTTNS